MGRGLDLGGLTTTFPEIICCYDSREGRNVRYKHNTSINLRWSESHSLSLFQLSTFLARFEIELTTLMREHLMFSFSAAGSEPTQLKPDSKKKPWPVRWNRTSLLRSELTFRYSMLSFIHKGFLAIWGSLGLLTFQSDLHTHLVPNL